MYELGQIAFYIHEKIYAKSVFILAGSVSYKGIALLVAQVVNNNSCYDCV